MNSENSELSHLQESSSNESDQNQAIKVVVRFRTSEDTDKNNIIIKEDGQVVFKRNENQRKNQTPSHRAHVTAMQQNNMDGQSTKARVFKFDAVTETGDQKHFYETYAKDNIIEFMNGFNSSIIAYGSTGTGKTFTIIGNEDVEMEILRSNSSDLTFQQYGFQGILPRSIETIFQEIEQRRALGVKFSLKCSYLEVYNEELIDLLQKTAGVNKKIIMQECPKRGVFIQNMEEVQVECYKDIFRCLRRGVKQRKINVTQDNNRSSRSHTIFILNMEQTKLDQTQTISRLNIVDLAGSEKLKSNEKIRLKETKNINTSLLTLTKCIAHLSNPSTDLRHVPFRDSKLTRILKESLGGNSKTTVICTARFSEKYQEDTIRTLRFAREAKKIQNKLQIQIFFTEEQLQGHIVALKLENASIYKELREIKSELAQVSDRSSPFIENMSLRIKDGKDAKESKNTKESLDIKESKNAKESKDSLIIVREELREQKLRFESLRKESENQILSLHLEIKDLNQKLRESPANQLAEIEAIIKNLSLKYSEQEREIEEEKEIIKKMRMALQEERNPKIEIKCNLIECENNRQKLLQFEKIFIQQKNTNYKLYSENQKSRKVLLNLNKQLQNVGKLDQFSLQEEKSTLSDELSCSSLQNDELSFEDLEADLSLDLEKDQAFLEELNLKIKHFEQESQIISSEIIGHRRTVENFSLINLKHRQPRQQEKSEFQSKHSLSAITSLSKSESRQQKNYYFGQTPTHPLNKSVLTYLNNDDGNPSYRKDHTHIYSKSLQSSCLSKQGTADYNFDIDLSRIDHSLYDDFEEEPNPDSITQTSKHIDFSQDQTSNNSINSQRLQSILRPKDIPRLSLNPPKLLVTKKSYSELRSNDTSYNEKMKIRPFTNEINNGETIQKQKTNSIKERMPSIKSDSPSLKSTDKKSSLSLQNKTTYPLQHSLSLKRSSSSVTQKKQEQGKCERDQPTVTKTDKRLSLSSYSKK